MAGMWLMKNYFNRRICRLALAILSGFGMSWPHLEAAEFEPLSKAPPQSKILYYISDAGTQDNSLPFPNQAAQEKETIDQIEWNALSDDAHKLQPQFFEVPSIQQQLKDQSQPSAQTPSQTAAPNFPNPVQNSSPTPTTTILAPTSIQSQVIPRSAVLPNDNLTPQLVQQSQEPDNNQADQGQAAEKSDNAQEKQAQQTPPAPRERNILINFNNVGIIEYLRFVSRISNKNFVFDEGDLQFNVTIVSEEPTSIDNVMTALLQELRIHDLTILEEGNNLIIHKNPKVSGISKVVPQDKPTPKPYESEIVTQVFQLNTLDPTQAAVVLKPLISDSGIVEVLVSTHQVIVTDIASNVAEINKLLKTLDSPESGLVIGQYVVRNTFMDTLIQQALKIMQPISQDQILTLVPHTASNSIFVVSSPFITEKTLSILQHLDQNQGITRIFNLSDLKYNPNQPAGARPGEGKPGGAGQWELDSHGNWIFRPGAQQKNQGTPPEGTWTVDPQGNWLFQPGKGGYSTEKPQGTWSLDSQGIWVFQLAPGTAIAPERLTRNLTPSGELPVGHIERTQFYIYKLLYRRGDQLEEALKRIADSMQAAGTTNQDLVAAINSIQWIESANSLILTGTPDALGKVKELIEEVDTPLRQVFIEMLILQTTISESLQFGVNWGSRFGGGNTAGAQAFLTGAGTLATGLSTATLPGIPDASILANAPEYHLGIIGKHLTHNGTEFNSIGALVSALHDRDRSKILLTPKILTEDNAPAEIFVGINTPFQTQSIANDFGSIITNNFDFRDVGTRLRVTPQIGSNGMITMDILEEFSVIQVNNFQNGIPTQNIGPTTQKNSTTTKVHIPDKCFLVISGIIQDQNDRNRQQLPCLGGLPLFGWAFSNKNVTDTRLNLMIFIRPEIIDTQEEIDRITKHQQDVFRTRCRLQKSWKYEVDEALDFLNVRTTDHTDDEGVYYDDPPCPCR